MPIRETRLKRPTRSAKPFKIKTRYQSAGKQRPSGTKNGIEDFLDAKLDENFKSEAKPRMSRMKRPSSSSGPTEPRHQAFMSSITDWKR